MEFRKDIRSFIEKSTGKNQFKDEDDIFSLGLVNSLFAMQLVNFIEQTYDMSINNSELDLDNFKNINAIVTLLERKAS